MTAGYVLLAIGVLLASWFIARDRGGVLIALGMTLGAAILALAWRPARSLHDAVPQRRTENDYVGASACRSCHAAEHASWQRTFHQSMTRVADRQSLAPSLPVRLELDGRSFEVRWRDDESIEVLGPDLHAWGAQLAELRHRFGPEGSEVLAAAAEILRQLPLVRRELVLVTGSHHYQAFWVEGGEGRELRQLPFVYLLDSTLPESERWLPRRDAFLQPPDAFPHVARWNANCVQCHSVAGRPGHSEDWLDPAGRYDTTVVDFGIACEACHGPGAAHVEHYQSPLARYLSFGDPRHIVNPARLDAEASSTVCGQCHSYFLPRNPDEWWETGFAESYRPGEPLSPSRQVLEYTRDAQQPSPLSRGLESVFWPDGTIRVGGREFNGLLLSPCFEKGTGARKLACVSCHSMHESEPEDQLAVGMDSQRACTQCHEGYATRLEEHTHHPAGSAGSDCYNCHMPRTTYALLKSIRSHRVTIPTVELDDDAAPNACNLCHLDRPLSWTQRWLSEWWGHPSATPAQPHSAEPHPAEHPPKVVAADPLPEENAARQYPASVHWLLAGNAAQRVLLADGMTWSPALEASGSGWQRAVLERAADDPYAAVRYVVRRSLKRLPSDDSPPPSLRWTPAELEELIQQRNDAPITISE